MSTALANDTASVPDTLLLPAPIRRLIDHLYGVFRAERVVLFGSYLKGTATSRSDIDLLALLPDDATMDEVSRRRGQLLAGLFPRVDLVITSHRELAEAKGERAAFLRSVMKHGSCQKPSASAADGNQQLARLVDVEIVRRQLRLQQRQRFAQLLGGTVLLAEVTQGVPVRGEHDAEVPVPLRQ